MAEGTEVHGGQGIQAGGGNVQHNHYYREQAPAAPLTGADALAGPALLTVVIEAAPGDDGMLESSVRAGDAEPRRRRAELPALLSAGTAATGSPRRRRVPRRARG